MAAPAAAQPEHYPPTSPVPDRTTGTRRPATRSRLPADRVPAAGYPQTGYGAPGTQPYAPPPRQGNAVAKGCLIAALIGVLVLGAAVVGGIYVFNRAADTISETFPSGLPTALPTGLPSDFPSGLPTEGLDAPIGITVGDGFDLPRAHHPAGVDLGGAERCSVRPDHRDEGRPHVRAATSRCCSRCRSPTPTVGRSRRSAPPRGDLRCDGRRHLRAPVRRRRRRRPGHRHRLPLTRRLAPTSGPGRRSSATSSEVCRSSASTSGLKPSRATTSPADGTTYSRCPSCPLAQ